MSISISYWYNHNILYSLNFSTYYSYPVGKRITIMACIYYIHIWQLLLLYYIIIFYVAQILRSVNFVHWKLCVINSCVIQLFYYTVLTFVQLIVPNSESDSIDDYYRWHHHLIFIHKFLFFSYHLSLTISISSPYLSFPFSFLPP